jgi:2-amino-4-hydroxy-6-hydroxymethyldihydropteridine diphosphokinase
MMDRFAATMNEIYLSLGSNMGDRAVNIARAVACLRERSLKVVQQSSLYETEPVDFLDQEWFLNCVIQIETELKPEELMRVLLEVERALGRERRIPKGPRVIDIDILLYGAELVRTPELKIPHPRMIERRFVLVPLAEIAPEVWHPVFKKAIAELLALTPDQSEVRRYGPEADAGL